MSSMSVLEVSFASWKHIWCTGLIRKSIEPDQNLGPPTVASYRTFARVNIYFLVLRFSVGSQASFPHLLLKNLVGSCQVTNIWRQKRYMVCTWQYIGLYMASTWQYMALGMRWEPVLSMAIGICFRSLVSIELQKVTSKSNFFRNRSFM